MKLSSRIFILFYLHIGWLPLGLTAQCPITVDAGPDQSVCSAGGTVNLTGSISGPYIGFRWSPATGLNDPAILTPTATVNGTATFTLTAAAQDPTAPNLVSNPAFEAGNTGFTSSYTYNPTPITPGTYVLTTSPALVLSTFPPCDDHTFGNGTGNMMLINGTGGASSQAWCQTIPVMANSWYYLSAWVMCSPISPPVLQFRVNGTLVGVPFEPPASGCIWQEFTASWFSGAATSATLCIMDLNGSGNGFFGDDYALDDIFMAKACTASDQVTVSVTPVNAVLPANAILGCNAVQTGIILNGSASSAGLGYTYSWDGPGIVSGGNTPIATVNEVGTYTLTVSYDTGNGTCTDQASVSVLPDPLQVTATATVDEELNCIKNKVRIDGTGSSTGPAITYNWQPAAAVVSGNGTLMPQVNQPGEYTLLVTNTASGCTATTTVVVVQNNTPAVAVASAPGPLSCTAATVTLSGAGSTSGGGVFYLWTGPGVVSGALTLNNCVVNAPGAYILTVTNDANGCSASATAVVVQSGAPPQAVASAAAPGILNCAAPVLTLTSAGSSSGANFTYLWTTPNGHFSGPANGQTVAVDSPGVYILTVANAQNGCTSTSTVVVTADFSPPAVSIQQPVPAISCAADSVQLNALPAGGPGFQYLWIASGGGHILSGDTTLTPWVDTAGVYLLHITNTLNGCTATATATVAADTAAPLAMAAVNAPGALDCATPALVLNSTGSTADSTVTYLWTTPNGHINGPDTAYTALADSAGLYILTITSLQNGCSAADTVAVDSNFTHPAIFFQQPVAVLTCAADSIQIDASASAGGPGYQLLWTTPAGLILSGDTTRTPWVAAAGLYILTISNTANGCTATDSVTVGLDTLAPLAQIVPPGILDCQTALLTLDATGSSMGTGFSLAWSFFPAIGTAGGGFVSGQNTLTPLVDAPGAYTLTVLDTRNQCQTEVSAHVGQDTLVPVADAGAPPVAGCGAQSAVLDGTGSSQGPDFAYLWTGGALILQPQITMPGVYTLTVTNTANHCTATDSVLVAPFGVLPDVTISSPPPITCFSPQTQLSATASTGPAFAYQWTFAGTGSGIVSGDTTLGPLVGSPGTYTLVVTNTLTGCTAAGFVDLQASLAPPVADAGAPQTLLCGVAQVGLDGAASSVGPNFNYTWTTPDGNLLSGQNSLAPQVNAPGTYILLVTDALNGCTAADSVQVQQDANAPVADAGPPQAIICLSATVALDGSGSSAGPSISYLWTTLDGVILSGQNTPSPVVAAPGTYLLAVTDASNNCQSLASVQVFDQTQAPQAVAASPQTLTCALPVVVLDGVGSSAGPGFSYQWSGPGLVGGSNALSAQANAGGLYALTVTDQTNGCTATASVSVAANTAAPQASAAALQTLTCALPVVALDGVGSSVGPGFSYQWSGPGLVGGSNALSAQANAGGLYALTVTDQTNGCTATASVSVAANTAAPQASAAALQTLTCALPVVALDGVGSSVGPGFSYQWSGPGLVGGSNALSAQANAGGLYALTVTDQTNGCTATASVSVAANTAAPQASAAALQTLTCALPVVALDGVGSSAGPGFSYQWSGPGLVGGSNALSAQANAGGLYALTVTDQTNGCTATAQTTVNQSVVPPLADAGPDMKLGCNMPTTVLAGSSTTPGAEFNWTTVDGHFVSGTSTPTPLVDARGVYTLLVTDPANGCTASSTVLVDASEVLLPTATSVAPDCITPTGTIVFSGGATGSYLYSIDDGAHFSQDSVFANLPAGLYPTVVQDAGGCEQTATVDLPGVTPLTVDLGPDQTVPAGAAVLLQPALNIPADEVAAAVWTPATGLDCADCLSPIATALQGLTYTVLVTSTSGCTGTASVVIRVEVQDHIYVPNVFSPDADGENDIFRVYTNMPLANFEMAVFDRWGGLLFQTDDMSSGWDGSARGKALQPGVYAYFIRFDYAEANGEVEKRLLEGGVLLVR
jgi:gliding motility-associated-like protein